MSESAHPPAGALVARSADDVVKRAVPGHPYSLDDGLGIRRVETDGRIQTETLALAPVLANHPVVEQAIRSRASRYADLDMRTFAPVRCLERTGASLHIVTDIPPGVRLSHLLAHLETTGDVLPEPAIFELASLKNSDPCAKSNDASIIFGPIPGFLPGSRQRRRPAIIR